MVSPGVRGAYAGVRVATRVLETVDAERLERTRALDGRRDIPARLEVSGHPPALVRVDHDLDTRADGVTHGLDRADVFPPVGVVEADLDRADPGVPKLDDPRGALLGRHELGTRGVREQPLGAASEQPPARRLERASGEIPDSRLERPGSSVVEVDRLADLVDDLGPQGIDTDEQPLEQVAVGQRIAARVALEPFVAADDHDRRLLRGAGDGIPRHP